MIELLKNKWMIVFVLLVLGVTYLDSINEANANKAAEVGTSTEIQQNI